MSKRNQFSHNLDKSKRLARFKRWQIIEVIDQAIVWKDGTIKTKSL